MAWGSHRRIQCRNGGRHWSANGRCGRGDVSAPQRACGDDDRIHCSTARGHLGNAPAAQEGGAQH